jgi:hypothetical protein
MAGRRGQSQRGAPQGIPRGAKQQRSTPGTLRLLMVGLVALCLGWGVLAALGVEQHASAAANAVGSSEPLSLDAQRLYQSLADADVTVSTAYLFGQNQPFADRLRYQGDIADAAADLQTVTAASGSYSRQVAGDLATLDAGLPVYTGYVEDGETYDAVGMPAGASFLEVASEEMHLVLLPAARDVYAQENAQLAAASAQATGLPFVAIVAVVTIGLLFVLVRTQRWLSRRTHRAVNGGLFIATLAGVVALIWLVVAVAAGRSDLLTATQHGSVPAQTLAQADIGALQARGDEAMNLISRTGDQGFQGDFHQIATELDSQLSTAATGTAPVGQVRTDAAAWFGVNNHMQALDAAYNYGSETQLAIGTGPGSAATLFGRLSADLTGAIGTDQATFAANAPSGQTAFDTLEIAVIVLALTMAAGCAWGIYRRLLEYR